MDDLLLMAVIAVVIFAACEFTTWRVRRAAEWEFEKERGDIWQAAYEQGIEDEFRSAEINHEYGPNRANPYRKR